MGRTNYAACLGDAAHASIFGPMNDAGTTVNNDRNLNTRVAARGVFVARTATRFRDVLDGLANTICAGEINTDLGDFDITTHMVRPSQRFRAHLNPSSCKSEIDPLMPRRWRQNATNIGNAQERRGFRWAHGQPIMTGMFTILPPNSELCYNNFDWRNEAVLPPSSRHQGGCHVLMADGAVKFITDAIEAGNSEAPAVRRGGPAVHPRAGRPSPYGLWGALGTRASKETISESF